MKILLTGANGFIGSAILERLLAAGHHVTACARSRRNLPASEQLSFLQADFTQMLAPEAWAAHLAGVEAVINCAGILRERRRGDFTRIHEQAPQALLSACQAHGTPKLIQISALGSADDGEFIASKHRFDAALLAAAPTATVIRPSVVVSPRGSYGGTSMLRALSATPGLLLLPGEGDQRIQPVLLEDLAELVLRCLQPEVAAGQVLYAVGPQVLTLREYLLAQRSWLKLPPPRVVRVPKPLIRAASFLGEHLNAGPLGRTITTMLERGNVAPAGAWEAARAATGYATRSVPAVLAASASFVQDRWHARLYLLRPTLWLTLVAVWLISGLAGLLATPAQFAPLLSELGVAPEWQRPLVWATSVLDIVLGLLLLLRIRVRAVLALMGVSVLAYTALLGVLIPSLWLDPLGALVKNLPILLGLLVYAVLEDQR